MHKMEKMKKYNKRELAVLIKGIINKYYSDPNFLYEKLKNNINGKSKAINAKDLTDEEYLKKGLKIAEAIINDFHLISIERIEYKLSEDIVNKASQGIDIREHKDFLFKTATERIRELINAKFKPILAKVRKLKKRK